MKKKINILLGDKKWWCPQELDETNSLLFFFSSFHALFLFLVTNICKFLLKNKLFKFNNVTKNLLIITPHCYHLCKWTTKKNADLRLRYLQWDNKST